jgi:hypothetical protein
MGIINLHTEIAIMLEAFPRTEEWLAADMESEVYIYKFESYLHASL